MEAVRGKQVELYCSPLFWAQQFLPVTLWSQATDVSPYRLDGAWTLTHLILSSFCRAPHSKDFGFALECLVSHVIFFMYSHAVRQHL